MFEEYMKIFIKHEINDKVLPNLKEKDLKDIDDLSVGARVRFMTWLENYQRLLLSAPASVSASTAAKTIEEKKERNEDEMCCYCCENMANMVFVPCGHVSMCEKCTRLTKNKDTCSVCREPGNSYKIFLAGV